MPRKTRAIAALGFPFDLASMRPRPDAAENNLGTQNGVPVGFCFNEAAARCRGKPAGRGSGAVRRGRASMRPRPDAAENRPAREAGTP